MSNHLRHLSPKFSIDEAKQIANEYYYLNQFIDQLPSERDQNFLFQRNQLKFILKISNIDENYSVIDMQNCAMKSIENGVRVLPAVDGKLIITYKNHLIRLVTYLPGIPLANYRPHSLKLFFNLGKLLANIDKSLIDFKHEGIKRDLYWNMINAEKIIKMYKHLIIQKNHCEIIENILHDWIEFVIPKFSSLRISVIHNDANDYNIIVTNEDNINLIDFGDMCQTFLVCEPAIACAYIMLDKENPIDSAANLIQGYHQYYPLDQIEIDFIYYFIRTRLAMSVTISAHQKQIQPDNHYLVISEKPAWSLLEKLATIDTKLVQQTFRSICHSDN
jgi:Ser/Thr protein kinase RdoA (MazF antagonist)